MTAQPSGSREGQLRGVLETVGLIIAPASFLTGLLYYFAWVREEAVFGYFGIDERQLGFTTQDYLARSAGVAFLPLAVLLLLGFAAVGLHIAVIANLRLPGASAAPLPSPTTIPPRTKRIIAAAGGVAVVCLTAGLLGLLGRSALLTLSVATPPLPAAVALGTGAAFAEWAVTLTEEIRRQYGHRDLVSPRVRTSRRVLTGAILVLAIFWATAIYATERGAALAHAIEANIPSSTEGVVYSRTRLMIDDLGVTSQTLGVQDAAYRFRYWGLHPIAHAKDRWYLLPAGWTHGNGSSVVVLPDDPTMIRVDLRP